MKALNGFLMKQRQMA